MKNLFCCCTALLGLLLGGCAEKHPLMYPVAPTCGTVIIGVVLPLTGNHAEYGRRLLDGVRFACEMRNSGRGLSGHPVQLIEADNGSDPQKTVAAAKGLVARGACAIVAGYSTEEVMPLRQEGALPGVPVINTMATGDDLAGSPLFISATFLEHQQAHVIAGYLWYYRKALRLTVLQEYGDHNHYSRRLARSTAQYFSNLGGTVSAMTEYDPEAKDFSRVLQSALAGGPNAVFIPAERAETAGRLIKALREIGFGGLIIGPDSWDDPELLTTCGEHPGDALYLGFYANETTSTAHAAFRDKFRKLRYFYPTSYEAQGYDSFNLLCDALGSAATEKEFEKNLTSIRNRAGAGGLYSLLPKGTPDRSLLLISLRPAPEPGERASTRLVRALTDSQFRSYEEINNFTYRPEMDEKDEKDKSK